MDKKQLLKDLEAADLLNNFCQRSEWARAFEAHARETGRRLTMTCSTCYREVLEWLRK
jgi:hypothetical protein